MQCRNNQIVATLIDWSTMWSSRLALVGEVPEWREIVGSFPVCESPDLRLIPAHLIGYFPLTPNTVFIDLLTSAFCQGRVSFSAIFLIFLIFLLGGGTVVDFTSALGYFFFLFLFLFMVHCCPPMEKCVKVCYSLSQKVKLRGVSTFEFITE